MAALAYRRPVLRLCILLAVVPPVAASAAGRDVRCELLRLEISRIEAPPSQYVDFCNREPGACALTGAAVIEFDKAIDVLERVNRAVNAEISLVPDEPGERGEECWEFPVKGAGDCEDFALEKRRQLVAEGMPSAALTMAIVHHETQFFAHAILLAETTGGTWVLDNLRDELVCWNVPPYRYERRERPDGQWERYKAR
jgi:predicted transglutaminase-like cysteine proteinase